MKRAFILFVVSLLSSFVILSEIVQEKVTVWLHGHEQEILSQLVFQQKETTYKLIKAQRHLQHLRMELYKKTDDGFIKLDEVSLRDKKDAYYRFEEDGKHNLFLKDINGNGENEIIAPTIDKNMRARLNIFRLDPVEEKLLRLSQP